MEHDAAIGGYRVFPYRYKIHGDQVTRVAPIGFDAHDFVGEWGNLPWEEAARWSEPEHLDWIREWYNKLRTDDGYFGGEFGTGQAYDPEQKFWQIEYNDSVYFQIERKEKWTFFVQDIGTKMREGCKDVKRPPGQPFNTMFSKPLEW